VLLSNSPRDILTSMHKAYRNREHWVYTRNASHRRQLRPCGCIVGWFEISSPPSKRRGLRIVAGLPQEQPRWSLTLYVRLKTDPSEQCNPRCQCLTRLLIHSRIPPHSPHRRGYVSVTFSSRCRNELALKPTEIITPHSDFAHTTSENRIGLRIWQAPTSLSRINYPVCRRSISQSKMIMFNPRLLEWHDQSHIRVCFGLRLSS
jgi:hypothetical protein